MCSKGGLKIIFLPFLTRLLHLTLNSHGQLCPPLLLIQGMIIYKLTATLRVGAHLFIASSGKAKSYR